MAEKKSFRFVRGFHTGDKKLGGGGSPLVYKGEFRDLDPEAENVKLWIKQGWVVQEEKPKPVK